MYISFKISPSVKRIPNMQRKMFVCMGKLFLFFPQFATLTGQADRGFTCLTFPCKCWFQPTPWAPYFCANVVLVSGIRRRGMMINDMADGSRDDDVFGVGRRCRTNAANTLIFETSSWPTISEYIQMQLYLRRTIFLSNSYCIL